MIPSYGWFGQLEDLSPVDGYRVRVTVGGDFELTGTPFDPTGATVDLMAGWTWIGLPSLTSLPLSSFTDALTDSGKLESNDQIKSQYVFTSYIGGYGWFGQLDTFEPGLGYMVKLAQANTLVSFGASTTADRQRKLEAVPFEGQAPHIIRSQPPRIVRSGEWQLAPTAFEQSMCIVAVVTFNGTVTQDGDLAAFVKGHTTGIAHPSSYVAPIGPYKGYKSYNLMAYGQSRDEHVIMTFQYRHADGHISKLATNTSFAKDASLGSVDNPFVIFAHRARLT